jgi:transposase
MLRITLSADDQIAVAFERYHHPEPIVQRKMEVLWLKHQGLPHHDIARLAGVSRTSVTRYLKEFAQGGLDAIRRFPWKRRRGQLEDYRTSLEEHFRRHPPRSLRQAQQAIEQQTGLRRGLTQVRRFLLRLGLKPLKAAAVPVPPKKTLEEHAKEQRRFLDTELEPRLREARAGLRDVYFVDASHFVFGSFLGCLWCFMRLCIRAASGRKRYNVLGALHAVSHRLIRVSNHSYINALSVCDLLRAVAGASVGLPITLVLDNARYQKCALVQDLARSLTIQLLYLPAYSPNLNLIERVWKFVKKECLQSREHADYEAFTAAIENCLGQLATKHKKDMNTLLTHEFQMFDSMLMIAA